MIENFKIPRCGVTWEKPDVGSGITHLYSLHNSVKYDEHYYLICYHFLQMYFAALRECFAIDSMFLALTSRHSAQYSYLLIQKLNLIRLFRMSFISWFPATASSASLDYVKLDLEVSLFSSLNYLNCAILSPQQFPLFDLLESSMDFRTQGRLKCFANDLELFIYGVINSFCNYAFYLKCDLTQFVIQIAVQICNKRNKSVELIFKLFGTHVNEMNVKLLTIFKYFSNHKFQYFY
ncbi:Hypothetical_protein [Hexamita inflata]|uniref:Hypothetical_protein n=1 Tax=Hexamita inflata TaxID=28002 RepID=A0AA86NMM2_9EUKA|nr:Hypothetical protein HINF_LOCUS9724 [Hexamita inflata]